jgi:hypothetical protein
MTTQQTFIALATCGLSSLSFAADYSFDRPGTGFATSTVPVAQLAWEQSLANGKYVEYQNQAGETVKHTEVYADVLLRTGLSDSLELQLGWQGPTWSKTKVAGQTKEDDGLGDVSIGLKKAIDLDDDKLSMALLAQAVIATGNDNFSIQDDEYSLGSAVSYQYSDDVTTAISMFYALQDGHWRVTAVPTLEYAFTPKFGGYSEFVYSKAEGQDYEYALGSGLVYQVNSRLQLDAGVGIGLNGSADQYQAALGFAYAF